MMDREKIKQLLEKRIRLYQGGGEKRIAKHHASGKLTARERLALLFDEDTFQETHLFMKHRCTNFGMETKELPGEGVVTGHGFVDGRPVYVASQDFTVAGGSVGEATAKKIWAVMDDALKTGDPFIFINDSGGARIQEGVDALSGYGGIFYRNVELSGVVPQISIIAGPCAGGAAYSPALTDFIIQVRHKGQLYITGPQVIKEVTGEEVTPEQLGGVESHAHYSGVIHFIAENDEDAILLTKRLLSFLPSNNTEDPPFYPELHEEIVAADESLNDIVPEDPREAYDMHEIIWRVVDGGDFLEVQEHFAPNIIIGFGRLVGRTIGIVANQPAYRAGVLDIDSSDKASRFIRFCNAFNIPLVTFVDVPGFLPGVQQEYGGIIRHGAKMLFAYGAATVPKLTVIVRKAYGGAYLAMCSKDMGADRVCAWPSAEIAVMGAEGAVNVLYKKEIAEAEDPQEEKKRRIQEYCNAFANPYIAAGRGYLDDIIEPAETRAYLAAALEVLRSKRELRPQKKHGLIPL
ncbi:MAG: acyl-CoA carboxylase subunit beta [Calditrichaeota bacterium]|nr:MAG: acyl-CoA carboxylase subunit beta [Calditrichota bacterium]